jgi:hypothetical protein
MKTFLKPYITMYFKYLLTVIAIMSALSVSAQIKVIADGKVGIGTAISPTSQLELGKNQWLKLSVLDDAYTTNYTGILFHESGTSTENDVQYGAKIFYDETNDRFAIVTKQNGVDNYGICIQRTYGRVGIGMTNPSYTLDVNGYVRATNVSVSSDLRLKTNVKDLDLNVLSKLNSLKAKTYKPMLREPANFYTPSDTSKNDTLPKSSRVDDPRNKTMIGFLAQDVQKLFPELVSTDEDGYLSLDYMGLIPVLVEAFKELNNNYDKEKLNLENLQNKLTDLESRLNQCCENNKLKSTQISSDIVENPNAIPVLYQNLPNPFKDKTIIAFYLPANVVAANLYIYNMQGTQIKAFSITARENGNIVIKGNELKPGMYLYSLIADGKEVDTKRMILTE